MLSKKLTKKTKKLYKSLDSAEKRSLGFVLVGLLLISLVTIHRVYNVKRLSFNTADEHLIISDNPPPVFMEIPKFKVKKNITPASISNQIWQIDEHNANHLSTSASPGDNGNIVIYGHNSNIVFGPLRWVSVGDEVEITSADDIKYKYIISEIIETDADDIQWVSPKQEEILTLYTCSGFLNKKRHVVVARPLGFN
ncbi:sortase domain-bontaining protein [Patescibacteria group bacterium]